MENNKFQPEFYDAVNKKDIPYLRNYVAASIRFDPAFNKSKCDACMKYLEEKDIDITEEYKANINEREVPEDKSKWTKELFQDKVEDLRQNFAYEKRIKELREIGPKVYADRIEKSQPENKSESFKEAPKGRRSSSTEKPSVAGVIAVIAVIAAVIGTIIYLLRK